MATVQLHVLTDQQLMDLLHNGDRDAFDQIFNRYWRKLFIYAGKVVRDEETAQDIVQDVFISLWQRKAALVGVDSLSSYLHGAIRYKGIGHIRANLHKSNYAASIQAFFVDGCDSLNEHIDLQDLNEVIHHEIGKLPPKMREIFIMSRMEHLSNKEIAEKLNISDKTVKKQINRALNLFRLVLDEKSGSLLHLAVISFLLSL